jgi:(p)ppGpp synthase/HD superfamily hydrolase
METIDRAVVFAATAHAGQRRKYTGDPYIVHPLEVMGILKAHHPGATEDMLVAAVLHDVLEDCPQITPVQIAAAFGDKVKDLVIELTDIPTYGNRATRKEANRVRLSKVSNEAKAVKIADLVSNTKDITRHDRAFAKVYLAEKESLLRVLKDAGIHMWGLGIISLEQAKRSLKETSL